MERKDYNEYIERLQMVIKHLHGSGSVHINSEPVHEVWQSKTVWQGEAEVFSLRNESKATVCYTWSYHDGSGEHIATVLNIPPVKTAQDAVKAHIVGGFKKKQARKGKA